jgi:hypothetical protein
VVLCAGIQVLKTVRIVLERRKRADEILASGKGVQHRLLAIAPYPVPHLIPAAHSATL